ncbi:MAG: DUF4224 domain-containing protein [Stenotrophomonas sp.]
MSAADICLSKDEVAALCRSPIRAKQIAFLLKNGIRHYLDNGDWPVVLRSTIDGTPAPTPAEKGWRPNKAA